MLRWRPPPGYALLDVIGDGNCMFRSISYYVHAGDSGRHADVRSDLTEIMQGNPAIFQCVSARDDSGADANFDEYIARMRRPHEWGDELCLLAASVKYKRAIHVWNPRADSWWSFGSGGTDGGEAPMYLFFRPSNAGAEHYMVLIKEGDPGKAARGNHGRSPGFGEPKSASVNERRAWTADSASDDGGSNGAAACGGASGDADKRPGSQERDDAADGGAGKYANYAVSYFTSNMQVAKDRAIRRVEKRCNLQGPTGASPWRARLGAQYEKVAARNREKMARIEETVEKARNRGRAPNAFTAGQQYAKAMPNASNKSMIEFLRKAWGGPFSRENENAALEGRKKLKSWSSGAADLPESNGNPSGSEDGKRREGGGDGGGKGVRQGKTPRSERAAELPREDGNPSSRKQGGHREGDGNGKKRTGGQHRRASEIYDFLKSNGQKTPDGESKWRMKIASANYHIRGGNLYYQTDRKEASRVLVSKEEQARAMDMAHRADCAGHYGVVKTYSSLRTQAKIFWPKMWEDVCDFVSGCDDCQRRSRADLRVKHPLRPIPYPKMIMYLVGLDVKAMPAAETGERYLMVATDYATKFPFARAVKTKSGDAAADFLFEEIRTLVGYVRYTLTDNGREFRNALIKKLAARLGVNQRFTRPYSPQTNGLTERMNGVIADRLAKIIKGERAGWRKMLPEALFAMRTSISTATGYSPAALLTGTDTVTPLYVEAHGPPPVNERELLNQLEAEEDNMRNTEGVERDSTLLEKQYELAKERLADEREGGRRSITPVVLRPSVKAPPRKRAHLDMFELSEKRHRVAFDEAGENQKKKTDNNVRNYNRRNSVGGPGFSVGDYVLEKDSQYTQNMQGRLSMRCNGPYRVHRINGGSLTIEKHGRMRTVSARNAKLYKKQREISGGD